MARIYQSRTLRSTLRNLDQQVKRQGFASRLARSGLSVPEEGVTQVDGTLDVVGDLNVSGNLGVSGPATFAGDTEIGGNAAITGTLSLPAGIIDNDALAHQTDAGIAPADTQTGWATTTSMATKASTSVTVPAGFTEALVVALGTVVFQDTAPNRFDSRCRIEGTNGDTIVSLASNVGNASPNHMTLLSVTGGQVINVDVQVLSAVATGGQPANQAAIKAFAVFLR